MVRGLSPRAQQKLGREQPDVMASDTIDLDEASYITGAELWVDGGSLAR